MNISSSFLISAVLIITGTVFQPHATGSRHLIAGSTASENPINIVFLSEGFTGNEENSFLSCCRTFSDTIFVTSPYKQFRSLFNVWGIFIASPESGTDHLSEGIYKDTYFGSYFSAIHERSVLLSNDGITKAYELLARHVPDYDMVCVIVNDQTYGGTGGAIAVVTTNASAAISTVHEFGHSFFNLADEYSEAFTITPREMPNITADTVRERVKWNAWIDSVTPLPTPVEPRYTKSVGLFEGAMYQTSGWYRPMLNCMMRSLRHPFCKVCLESHIAKIYEFVSPIAGSYPERDTCTFNGENEMLLVKTVHLDTNTISVQWKVNGTLIINNSDTLKLLNISLQKGTNRVTAIVQDTTGDVRIPENLSLLKDSTCWVVHYDPVNNRIETMRNNSIPEFYYADKTVKVSYKSDFSIELVNLSGVSFTKMKCNDQGILDTRFIPSGVYIISIGNHRTRVTRRILLK